MMPIINVLLFIILLLVAGAVLWWAMSKAPLASPFKEWVIFIVAQIFALVLIGVLFGGIATPTLLRGG
jgi:hypothetical protein